MGSGIPGCRENVWNGEPLMLSDKEVDENNLSFSSIIWEDSLSIPEVVKKLALLKYPWTPKNVSCYTRHATLQFEFHQTCKHLNSPTGTDQVLSSRFHLSNLVVKNKKKIHYQDASMLSGRKLKFLIL